MLFFDPSFLIVAEANDNKTPAAEVEQQRAKKPAPFNPKTGPGSKQENAPLPPPPDKTTAPRGVDEAGSPTPAEPEALPPGVTDLPAQIDDAEDPEPRAKRIADEPERLPPSNMGRSPWGGGSSGVR